jgi:hypothetical protein
MAPAHAVAIGFLASNKGILQTNLPSIHLPPPVNPGEVCMRKCEDEFQKNALQANLWVIQANVELTKGNLLTHAQHLERASFYGGLATQALISCLSSCPGIPFFGGIPAFVDYARHRYLMYQG